MSRGVVISSAFGVRCPSRTRELSAFSATGPSAGRTTGWLAPDAVRPAGGGGASRGQTAGPPAPPEPRSRAARRANHHTPAWREKIRARFRERGSWLQPDTVPWTAEQELAAGHCTGRRGRSPARSVARCGVYPASQPGDRLAPGARRRSRAGPLRRKGLEPGGAGQTAGVHRASREAGDGP